MSFKNVYENLVRKHGEEVSDDVYRLLVALRRNIAKDGPQDRPAGALEAFDAACDELGIPFLKP